MTTSTAPSLASSETTTISSLPTELLVRLLSYLPAIDLLSAKRTNRRIHNVVTDSSYLQYILRIQVNGVDDLLPPDYPIAERLRLLRQHENSWNCLRYNTFTENSFLEIPVDRSYILQDGYLIYRMPPRAGGDVILYGYVDLHSTSPNVELRWVHILLQQMRFPFPLRLEFAVDHNLVVAIRCVSFWNHSGYYANRPKANRSTEQLLMSHSSSLHLELTILFHRRPLSGFHLL